MAERDLQNHGEEGDDQRKPDDQFESPPSRKVSRADSMPLFERLKVRYPPVSLALLARRCDRDRAGTFV